MKVLTDLTVPEDQRTLSQDQTHAAPQHLGIAQNQSRASEPLHSRFRKCSCNVAIEHGIFDCIYCIYRWFASEKWCFSMETCGPLNMPHVQKGSREHVMTKSFDHAAFPSAAVWFPPASTLVASLLTGEKAGGYFSVFLVETDRNNIRCFCE